MPPPPAVTSCHFDEAHPTALAIYCSDGRFTRAVETLLADIGEPRLDTLTIPGGPALLASGTSSYGDREVLRRAADFLILKHHITRVVLLAHQGCGYYRTRFPGEAPEVLRARKLKDLREAGDALALGHRGLERKLYYARVEGDQVLFDAVEASASAPGSR